MNRYRPPPAILRINHQNQMRQGYMSHSRLKVLAAIIGHTGPITIREIMDKTGMRSTFGVLPILDDLKAEGFIDFELGKSRTIRPTCRAYLPGKVPQKGQS